MITLLSPYSAALVTTQKTRMMVIADLHIGWEMSLSKKGIHVPTQTPKLLEKLMNLVSDYEPEKLLILGDVKHTVATAELGEWQDIPNFIHEVGQQVEEVQVIPGNHDGNLEPLLPEKVKLLPATGVAFGKVGFFHGHRWPSPSILGCKILVMGHVHPVIAFRDPAGFRVSRQVWVKLNCDKTQLTRVLLQKHRIKTDDTPEETLLSHYKIKPRVTQLFIMPSFNDVLGGRPLNERRSDSNAPTEKVAGPVLRSEAVNMENAEAYLLDGTFLGTLDRLRLLS